MNTRACFLAGCTSHKLFMNCPAPATQQILVEQFLSWQRVEARLAEFPAIARAFPVSLLRERSRVPPYFCHYMAWRLGTFDNEYLIARLNKLLEHAESLSNWKYEKPLLRDGDFAAFWSLVWQLQVAEYLSKQGGEVSWSATGGPDLSFAMDGRKLFVECYVYRKSFGAEIFIEELLSLLGDDLRVSRDLCLPFSMPNDIAALSEELSTLLSPLLVSEVLAAKRCLAQASYPIVLSRGSRSTLVISLEGPFIETYDPSAQPQSVGDPNTYLEIALREAAKSKAESNNLGSHHPNLVVVNYALSADAQLALTRQQRLSQSLPDVCVSENIDAFAFATIGIDGALSKHDLKLVLARSENHPAHTFTVSANS